MAKGPAGADMSPARFRRIMNLWPPFLCSGIKIERIAPDFRAIDVSLTQRWYNRNIYGTHFGGSLFAMTDPFYVIMLVRNLPRGHIIWDKHTEIDFKSPGRGKVTASFALDASVLASIEATLASSRKMLQDFSADILDAKGSVVASVKKSVYIRRSNLAGAER